MRFLMLFLAFPFFVQAQESGEFKVQSVIHSVVQKLEKPRFAPDFVPMPLAISTQSEVASNHVLAGITYLNSAWDFEAYRHFCAAVEADPDCLMAYWGVAMSLGGLNHEFYEPRKAAVDRMLDLLEQGVGVDWEKGFGQAAGRLYANGAEASALVYKNVAEKFPNNLQAQLFSFVLIRDGYSSSGQPNVGQRKAMAGLEKLVKANPENIAVISTWVMAHGDAPLKSSEMREEVLPFVRKLVRLHPDYAPFQLIATHVESRCGNASLAINHARRAIDLFEAYCEQQKVSIYDCPGLIQSRVFLATLLAGKDHFEEAYEIADALAQAPIDGNRVFSKGASLMLWEGRSLGPRLALMRGTMEDLERGLDLLKFFPDEEWFDSKEVEKKKSLAISYRNALAYCIGVRKALLKNDESAIRGLYANLSERVKQIDLEAPLARKTSSYSEYLRARSTARVFAIELRGLIDLRKKGAMKLGAFNWFSSASDLQSRPLNLLPMAIPYPMENRIGEFYLATDKPEKAAMAYRQGLERMPNHLGSLRGYRSALLKMGENDAAEKIAERIELVKK